MNAGFGAVPSKKDARPRQADLATALAAGGSDTVTEMCPILYQLVRDRVGPPSAWPTR
jgi:hypothetical protein